jgi:hypothetical protein
MFLQAAISLTLNDIIHVGYLKVNYEVIDRKTLARSTIRQLDITFHKTVSFCRFLTRTNSIHPAKGLVKRITYLSQGNCILKSYGWEPPGSGAEFVRNSLPGTTSGFAGESAGTAVELSDFWGLAGRGADVFIAGDGAGFWSD